jgi:imidazole glycerol-phosphate synthase subunit HisF
MLTVRVIPCLLVCNRKLVKTVKFKNPAYVGDPVNAIKIYNEKEVDELIVLDITASVEGRAPNFGMIADIAGECFMPLTYGGGIRKLGDLCRLFKIGVEKVAFNSSVTENPGCIREAVREFGSQSIIASIDVRRGFLGRYDCYIRSGSISAHVHPVEMAKHVEDLGAGEILLTSIDRDGTWQGYDIDILGKITSAVSIPVIACGGAGKIEDFRDAVVLGGASAVAAGSMVVYQKKGMGVLINFPKRDVLTKLLDEGKP